MPDGFARLKRRAVAEVLGLWRCAAPPLPPVVLPLATAAGATLAAPLVAAKALPERAVALIDGAAVFAHETVGASPYHPAELTRCEPVAAGAVVAMPFDAVAPLAAGGVDAAVAPGENLRRIGEDMAAGETLLPAGRKLDGRALALAAAAGIAEVSVRRARLAIRTARPAGAAAALLAALCDGATPDIAPLAAPVDGADIVVFLGGDAIGAADAALLAARAAGWRPFGPVALRPGASMLAGTVDGTPALLLADTPADALTAALALLRPLLAARLGAADERRKTLPLARKIASAVGFCELALVAETTDGAAWAPFAAANLAALAQASAWALLAPESEGFDAGTLLSATLFADAPDVARIVL